MKRSIFKKPIKMSTVLLLLGVVFVVCVIYSLFSAAKPFTSTDTQAFQQTFSLDYTPQNAQWTVITQGEGPRTPIGPEDYGYVAYVELKQEDIDAVKAKLTDSSSQPGTLLNERLYMSWFPDSLKKLFVLQGHYYSVDIVNYPLSLISKSSLRGTFFITPDNHIVIIAYTT